MNITKGICSKCGKNTELIINNNPLLFTPICPKCVNEILNYNNIEHADFFCRTFNFPFDPELWMKLAKEYAEKTWIEYVKIVLNEEKNKPNLMYESSTADLWTKLNKEWEKIRTFTELLNSLADVKDSYIIRAHIKWGDQYTFNELIRLDSMYTRTLRANNITNPIQKEAVKTLCKLQLSIDDAIRSGDPKSIKDFSSAYAAFAKQADLETMIAETKTDDITTVAELYEYMEKQGFQFKFYDGFDRDEVDRSIKDIQETNRRLILEATGIEPTLEAMIKKRAISKEEQYAEEIAERDQLQEMLNFSVDDFEVEAEDDSEVLGLQFDQNEEEFVFASEIKTMEDEENKESKKGDK